MKVVLVFTIKHPGRRSKKVYKATLAIEEHDDAPKKLSRKDFCKFSKDDKLLVNELYVKSCGVEWDEDNSNSYEHAFISTVPFKQSDGRDCCRVTITTRKVSSVRVRLSK